MTVTIIVPVYGVERYIRECAESLFAQTYEDIEYVFCDDCTPDRSIDVLHEVMAAYPQRKVRIIRNKQNKGIVLLCPSDSRLLPSGLPCLCLTTCIPHLRYIISWHCRKVLNNS